MSSCLTQNYLSKITKMDKKNLFSCKIDCSQNILSLTAVRLATSLLFPSSCLGRGLVDTMGSTTASNGPS